MAETQHPQHVLGAKMRPKGFKFMFQGFFGKKGLTICFEISTTGTVGLGPSLLQARRGNTLILVKKVCSGEKNKHLLDKLENNREIENSRQIEESSYEKQRFPNPNESVCLFPISANLAGKRKVPRESLRQLEINGRLNV